MDGNIYQQARKEIHHLLSMDIGIPFDLLEEACINTNESIIDKWRRNAKF